jgi:hypothetical protein
MDEHKKYLADRLLSEEQPVRSVSISESISPSISAAKLTA